MQEVQEAFKAASPASYEPVPVAGKDWEVDRARIIQVKKLGEGHFGMGMNKS